MALNKVMIIGNICRDVELRKTQGGVNIASFTVACSEKWTDKQGQKQEKTEFVNCSAWGKIGEIINAHFSKGSEIYVEGRYTTDEYEKDGSKRYSTKVVVKEFAFTGGSKRDRAPKEQYANEVAGEFYGNTSLDASSVPFGDGMPF